MTQSAILRGFCLVWLGLLSWGCAAQPIARMEDDAARRRVDLIVRDAQAEVTTMRQEVAAARIAAAKKEAELPELRRQVAELQRTAEAKQGELAALRVDRDRLLQTKTAMEQQVAEPLRSQQSAAEVAETQTKLKELETTQAALTAELAEMKRDLARTRGKAGGQARKPAATSPMPEASTKPAAAAEASMSSDRRPVRIAVERGDTLALLAQLYGVSVPALKDANGLRSDLILVGQELVIPRSPGMGRQPGANGR